MHKYLTLVKDCAYKVACHTLVKKKHTHTHFVHDTLVKDCTYKVAYHTLVKNCTPPWSKNPLCSQHRGKRVRLCAQSTHLRQTLYVQVPHLGQILCVEVPRLWSKPKPCTGQKGQKDEEAASSEGLRSMTPCKDLCLASVLRKGSFVTCPPTSLDETSLSDWECSLDSDAAMDTQLSPPSERGQGDPEHARLLGVPPSWATSVP